MAADTVRNLNFDAVLARSEKGAIIMVKFPESSDAPPQKFTIGNRKHIRENNAFQYVLTAVPFQNGMQGLYVCETPCNEVPGEVMFIMGHDEWWYACEGTIGGDGRVSVRQACFRTQTSFWEAGDHMWQVNNCQSADNAPETHWYDGDWENEYNYNGGMRCQTQVVES